MEPLFTWLHLSDLHCGDGGARHSHDRRLVLHALAKDISAHRERGVEPPDAIFLTGDIAFSGGDLHSEEYQEAGRWLDALCRTLMVPRKRIIMVPGNHDVQRSIDQSSSATRRIVEAVREAREDIDDVLTNPEELALLSRRQGNFLAFQESMSEAGSQLFHCASWVLPNGLSLRIIALNTALLCANDSDYGKLQLGNSQLSHALTSDSRSSDELVIVLSHHPLDWLRDGDVVDIWLQRATHVHLSGHMHQAGVEKVIRGTNRNIIRIAAGAMHAQDNRRFGYNISAVFLAPDGRLVLRSWPRVWSQTANDYRQDIDCLPDGQEFCEYKIDLVPSIAATPGATKPFSEETFLFDLPEGLDTSAGLLPIPCVVEGFGADKDCTELLLLIINDHFASMARLERAAYEEAWSEAWAVAEKKVAREEIGQDQKRDHALRVFQGKLPTKLLEYRPNPLWLFVLGETGAGKTTILQNLAAAYGSRLIDLRDYSPIVPLSLLLPARRSREESPGERRRRDPEVLVLDALDKMTPGATHLKTVENIREIRASAKDLPVVVLSARSHFFSSGTEEHLRGVTRVHLLPIEFKRAVEYARRQGQELDIDPISSEQGELRRMACKPLLLNLLLEVKKRGLDIATVVDDEHLFSGIVDIWLARDTEDSVLQNTVRLKCMQSLALHALGTGGQAISYSAIDALIMQVLAPERREDIERFNVDLRTCGFLRRTEADEFEFQHAAFYEYCVARTIFEDLKVQNFSALASRSFNEEILAFFKKRVERSGRADEIITSIRDIWRPGGNSSKARANLLKLYSALRGNCWELPLDGLVIENESLRGIKIEGERTDEGILDLDGIELIRKAGKRTLSKVSFIGCDLAGVELLNVQGYGWIIERCSLVGSRLVEVRLDECESIDSAWLVGDGDCLQLFFCDFRKGLLGVIGRGSLEIRWGYLSSVEIFGAGRYAEGRISHAVIEDLSPSGAMGAWQLGDCSLDGLSLCKLSNCRKNEWPRLSDDLKEGVLAWSRGTPVDNVTSPRARRKPLPGENEFYSMSALSRTQLRKVGGVLEIRRRQRDKKK